MREEITIVIPTLNEEHYLPLLLTDLVNQTKNQFNVIVVDAKSQDNTKNVAESFKKKLSLQFIESSAKGAAVQRNVGAKHVGTEYIFFLDADTRLDKDVIAKILKRISKDHKELYLPFVQPSTSSPLHRALFFCSISFVRAMKFIGYPISTGPHIVVNKDLFEKIRGFDESIKIGEDHNLIMKAHKKGVSPELIYGVGCYFSMRRFEVEGTWKITWDYLYYTILTILTGGVKKPTSEYEMGGLRYEQAKAEKK